MNELVKVMVNVERKGTSFRTSVTFDPKRKVMLTYTHEGFHELLGLKTWLDLQLK